jgi:DNA polymerase-1
LKISNEEALALKAAGDKGADDARQKAKAANFGFPGGLGWLKFMAYAKGYGVTMSANEARAAKEGWQTTWPEQEGYFGFVRAVIGSFGNQGKLIVPRSGFVREGVGHNDCANTPFQHLAALASKNAIWHITRRCFDPAFRGVSWLFGSRPFVFVHDEIGVETDDAIAHEVACEMEVVMAEAQQVWTPSVPATASASISTCWSKKAKKLIVDGRRVAWSPPEKKAA